MSSARDSFPNGGAQHGCVGAYGVGLLFLAAVLGWLFLCISGPFSLPWTFGFLQLKPNSVSQDNFRFLTFRFLTFHVFLRYTFSYTTRFLTLHVFLRCVASAYTMHFRGRSTSVVLRVCFIQQLIQDGIIIAKQCPTAVQIADIGTALPRVPFKSFSNQLLGDNYVGDY